jgi:hypothetical protein
MLALEENLQTLKSRLDAPCLGVIPWMADPKDHDSIAGLVSIEELVNTNTLK